MISVLYQCADHYPAARWHDDHECRILAHLSEFLHGPITDDLQQDLAQAFGVALFRALQALLGMFGQSHAEDGRCRCADRAINALVGAEPCALAPAELAEFVLALDQP